jgi:HlyD family type I secretion membrane fusion protein
MRELAPAAGTVPLPDHGARGSILAGSVVMAAFFAGLGGWAAVAPLHSAVVAPAIVKVEGNRKAVQHLEGGIVRELRVQEGDRVTAGQVLLVLDDTQARGAVELLSQQHVELRVHQARLLSEQAEAASMQLPDDVRARMQEPEVARIAQAQAALFRTRRTVLLGQIAVMEQKIAQAREQITGSEGQLAAQRQQLGSIRGELTGLQVLFKRGYVPRQRMLELERGASALEGQVVQSEVNIVKLRQSVEELGLQMAQLKVDRMAQIAAELRELQVRLIEVEPRLEVAREALKRAVVTAPVSGAVVGLSAFTVGGVIAPGERIMEIVPDHGDLGIEATLNVEDQKDVRPGMQVEVHLIAYKQRTSPVVPGTVVRVSADRLTDQRTGIGYYLAHIKVAPQDLARVPSAQLAPGMPVTAIIPTGARTALDYLLQPLTDTFNRGLREK